MTTPALDANLREAFGRVTYSHKTHEKMIDQLSARVDKWKTARLVLVSLTTGGIFTTIFNLLGLGAAGQIVAAVTSTASLGLAIYQWSFSHERVIQEHRKAANKLWVVREQYCNLITDLVDGSIRDEEARQKRDELTLRLETIYGEAPQTNSDAYEDARRALRLNEEMTFAADEVDLLLPTALRRNQTVDQLDASVPPQHN